jgi:hypothetical protein
MSAPKKAKTALREKQEAKKERTLGEITMKKIWVTENISTSIKSGAEDKDGDGDDDPDRKPVKKTQKVVRQKFAVGGLDLDEDWNSGSGKQLSKKKKDARELAFKEFDPNKRLRKGGKIGKASFKSKGKFKRRK